MITLPDIFDKATCFVLGHTWESHRKLVLCLHEMRGEERQDFRLKAPPELRATKEELKMEYNYTLHRYLFLDLWTNEVFTVESSFAIWNQAIERSPKYILARIEYGMGFGDKPEYRFKYVGVETEMVTVDPPAKPAG